MKWLNAGALYIILSSFLFMGCPTGSKPNALAVCDKLDAILQQIHSSHLNASPSTRFVHFNTALLKFYKAIGASVPVLNVPANGDEVAAQCRQSLITLNQRISKDETRVQGENEGAILLIMDYYLRQLDPHSHVDDISDLTEAAKLTALPRMLGFRLDLTQNPPHIQEVVPGSPAHLAGIEEDSELLKINDTDVSNATPETLSLLKQMTSKASSQVRLLLQKPDGVKREYVLQRDYFVESAVSSQSISMDSGFIGYIKLRRFNQKTDRLSFAESLQGLEQASAIVLDLRDNIGGDVDGAAEIANQFIAGGGAFAAFLDQNGHAIETKRYPRDNSLWDGPLVVIVNRNTKSAAELLTAALQDYGIIVVGERTAGEGTTQKAVSLAPFGLMATAYVTDAFDYRPSGMPTQLDGVTPDIFVDQSSVVPKSTLREIELKNHIEKPAVTNPLYGFDGDLRTHAEAFHKRLNTYLKSLTSKKQKRVKSYSSDAAIDRAIQIGRFLCKEANRCP